MRAALLAVLLALGLSTTPANARPGPDTIASGSYDEMLIGVDPATHQITGYFQSETGRGQFSCIFYFSGKPGAASTPIRSYFPETPGDVIAGKLIPEARDRFRVRLDSEHGGCGNVEHFADDDQPAEFTLGSAFPWISVAVVKSAKAHFYDTPAATAPRKTYVVKGDGLGVRATRPGWLQVDFVGGDKPVSGWVRSADVYPAP